MAPFKKRDHFAARCFNQLEIRLGERRRRAEKVSSAEAALWWNHLRGRLKVVMAALRFGAAYRR